MAYPQINEVYLALTKVAGGADFRGYLRGLRPSQRKNTVTYGELSRIYKEITSLSVDPQFGWTKPLDDLYTLVALAGLPPLSSLVVCGDAGEPAKAFLPGDGYWAGLKPTAPADPARRLALWEQNLARVVATSWPPFPTLAKDPRVTAHFLALLKNRK